MGVSLETWRARIGSFCPFAKNKMKFPALYINKGAVSNTVRLALAFSLIILTCGDVESNPGPTLPPDHQADARQTRSSSSSLRQTTLTSQKTPGSKPLNLEYLNNELSLIKQEVIGLKTEVNKLRSENEALRKNVQYLEDQSRRDNLIFNGIEESENETWDDVEQKVRDIMADNLNIENARNDADVGIERTHRLNVKHRQPNRPIGVNPPGLTGSLPVRESPSRSGKSSRYSPDLVQKYLKPHFHVTASLSDTQRVCDAWLLWVQCL